jgi:hypothetical protein
MQIISGDIHHGKKFTQPAISKKYLRISHNLN